MATDDRSARPENVEGSFYVDHTCIGKFVLPLLIVMKTQSSSNSGSNGSSISSWSRSRRNAVQLLC
jgi:hypothetical protein